MWGSSWITGGQAPSRSGGIGVGTTPAFLPECETPQTVEEYQRLAKTTLENLLRLENGGTSEGWTQIDIGTDEVLLTELPDDTGFSCLKTEGILPAPPKKAFAIASSQDIKVRQKWDGDVLEMRVVEEITPEISVIYRNYKAPTSLVAPREFVALSAVSIERDGTYISYGCSINHRDVKETSKFVRGNIIVTGLIFRPLEGRPNECYCIRIVHLDPKGMIPTWVVNATKKGAGRNFIQLRKLVQQTLEEEKNQPPVESPADSPQIPRHDSVVEERAPPLSEVPSTHDTQDVTQRPARSDSKNRDRGSSLKRPATPTLNTNFSNNNNSPSFSEPVTTQVVQSTVISSEVENLLQALNNSLKDVQVGLRLNAERIQQLESHINVLKNSSNNVPRRAEPSYDVYQPRIGWDFIGFALVWPFITYAVIDYIQHKRQK